MPSAQIDAPPSAAKRELIRACLRLTGLQSEIDDGRVLGIYAGPGSPLHEAVVEAARSYDVRYAELIGLPNRAIRFAYEKHRLVWQAEYEAHLHWEFTEEELREIVTFFDSPAGRHYREAGHRMRAYIGTNTEHLLEEIVREAIASLPHLAEQGSASPPKS